MLNLSSIDAKKQSIDDCRPLNNKTVLSIIDDLRLRYTYNSNAIEGNTLSISETKAILEHGITIGGKTLNEHFEAINHDKAINLLLKFVDKNDPLSIKVILDFHSIILKNIDDEWAGRFRNGNVRISGAKNTPVSGTKVYDSMVEFLEQINQPSNLHPILKAAAVHLDFVKIHPFFDGNGRTARLMMNLVLMQHGYPITIIGVENRVDYCQAIEDYCLTGNSERFNDIVVKSVEDSLDIYLETLMDIDMDISL